MLYPNFWVWSPWHHSAEKPKAPACNTSFGVRLGRKLAMNALSSSSAPGLHASTNSWRMMGFNHRQGENWDRTDRKLGSHLLRGALSINGPCAIVIWNYQRVPPVDWGPGWGYQGFESAPNHLIFNEKNPMQGNKKETKHTAAYLNEPNYNHQLINWCRLQLGSGWPFLPCPGVESLKPWSLFGLLFTSGYHILYICLGSINDILVGGIPTPLKNDGVRQLGWFVHFQLNGKS